MKFRLVSHDHKACTHGNCTQHWWCCTCATWDLRHLAWTVTWPPELQNRHHKPVCKRSHGSGWSCRAVRPLHLPDRSKKLYHLAAGRLPWHRRSRIPQAPESHNVMRSHRNKAGTLHRRDFLFPVRLRGFRLPSRPHDVRRKKNSRENQSCSKCCSNPGFTRSTGRRTLRFGLSRQRPQLLCMSDCSHWAR